MMSGNAKESKLNIQLKILYRKNGSANISALPLASPAEIIEFLVLCELSLFKRAQEQISRMIDRCTGETQEKYDIALRIKYQEQEPNIHVEVTDSTMNHLYEFKQYLESEGFDIIRKLLLQTRNDYVKDWNTELNTTPKKDDFMTIKDYNTLIEKAKSLAKKQ